MNRIAPVAERPQPTIRFDLHADDFGLSAGITDRIATLIEAGALTGVSIAANGTDFVRAAKCLEQHPEVLASLHLNLIEGAPLADPTKLEGLLGADGALACGFVGLWARWLVAGRAGRARLRAAVRTECAAQIERFRKAMPGRPLRIDGHGHLHMVPFVFKIVLELADEVPIDYLRIPAERFFLAPGAGGWRRYFGPNLLKHVLLGRLARRAGARARARGIATSAGVIGILFTGAPSEASLRRAARRAPEGLVEVILHPGRAGAGEEALWAGRPALGRWHRSPARDAEYALIASGAAARAISDD